MKAKRFYFLSKDGELCYTLEYVRSYMSWNELDSITIYPAIRTTVPNVFWCNKYELVGDKSEGSCGKECQGYKPKNGKSGCCIHCSRKMYEPSVEPITITLSPPHTQKQLKLNKL